MNSRTERGTLNIPAVSQVKRVRVCVPITWHILHQRGFRFPVRGLLELGSERFTGLKGKYLLPIRYLLYWFCEVLTLVASLISIFVPNVNRRHCKDFSCSSENTVPSFFMCSLLLCPWVCNVLTPRFSSTFVYLFVTLELLNESSKF